MLNENEIIDIVEKHYLALSYSVKEKCHATQKGIDLVLENDDGKIYIEAKGATSSKEGTKNYGNPFNRNQVKIHIAKAFFQIATLMTSHGNKNTYLIVLPDNENHRLYLKGIQVSLQKLKIKILLVNENKDVIEYL